MTRKKDEILLHLTGRQSLEGPKEKETTVLQIQNNWKQFEKHYKNLQINLANNNKLINNQKKIIRRLKETRQSQSQVMPTARVSQSKIIELEVH